MTVEGWALLHQHRAEEGLRRTQQGVPAMRALGTGSVRSYLLVLLADGYTTIEHAEEGLQVLAECDDEAEIYHLKSELLRQQSPDSHMEAASCWQHAMAIAHNQRAKSSELRAATSLCV